MFLLILLISVRWIVLMVELLSGSVDSVVMLVGFCVVMSFVIVFENVRKLLFFVMKLVL